MGNLLTPSLQPSWCSPSYTTTESWQTTRNSYIDKYNLIFSFFDDDACMEQEINRRKFALTMELSGVGATWGNWVQPKFKTLYSLKTYTRPTWPCLFTHAVVIFSLAIVYTHAMLVFYWSRLTIRHCLFSGIHFIDFIYGRVYLSTTSSGFIAGQSNIL